MMSDDSMPEMSVCARLRNERERRQIPLSSISANTKISASLFAALERGDLSRWPSGIFRRSFVRAYAEAIGLDPDEIIREFLTEFPDPPDLSTGTPSATAHAVKPATPADGSGLRLKLADAPGPFVAGPLLDGLRQRLAAAGCDAGVIAVIALCVFIATDMFWLPVAVVTVGYYLGGILLLGNTPGVCLLAPVDPTKPPYNQPPDGIREPESDRHTPHSDWHLRVPAR
jgi:transcriptional regulator with XRE-family HTH domain